MKKSIAGALAPAALVLTICLIPAAASAQRERGTAQFADPLILRGPGSTLGVGVRDLTAADASRANITDGAGVSITAVRPGTAAARAGLEVGDIVVEFDSFPVRGVVQFFRLVEETPPGRTVKATMVRGGSRRTIEITPDAPGAGLREDLRALPNDRLYRMPRLEVPPLPPSPPGRRIGTTLLPLNDQLAEYFGVKQGALVSSVDPASPAARAGLKAGDVIIGVNDMMVTDPQSVRDAVTRAGSTRLDVSIVRERKNQTIRIPASN